MEPILNLKITTQTIFENDPSMIQLLFSLGIVFIMLVVYIIIKKFASRFLKREVDSIQLPLTQVLIVSGRKILELFFLSITIYFVVYNLPFTEKLSSFIFRVLEVAFILIVTVYLARVGRLLLRNYQTKNSETEQTSSLFEIILKIIIFTIGGLIMLQSLGISITPLLTALGVGGLAVALALQETLSNLFAGLQIIAAKNMQPGDFIQIESGDEGYIVDIGWRSTLIRALPNRIIIIPNSKLSASTVKNFSKPDLEVAVLIPVGVSYNSDLKKVENVTIDVAKQIQTSIEGAVKDFEPFIRYHTFDAYSINFTVIVRVQRYVDQYIVKHEFVKLLHERYRKENIEIPFPITTVMMNQKK